MSKNNSNLPPIPPGWVGGFAESNPDFAYPKPDLSSLHMTGNMEHIPFLKRQQGVRWPEFSWQTEPGDESTRGFQMFSPFVSRLGYNNAGRIYSIICPQQGVWVKDEVCLNVEVTVTGVRGWVNESDDLDKRIMAADMKVRPRVWLTPSQHQGSRMKEAWPYLQSLFPELPLSKKQAIIINTSDPNPPHLPAFHVRKGESPLFDSPSFAQHYDDRGFYTVANLGVEIGDIEKRGDAVTDGFNQLLMDGFNIGSGNMLAAGNVLTWNVWFTEPQLVNPEEWQNHAENWRTSIDAHHGPPYSKKEIEEWPHLFAPRPVRFSDGTHFNPIEDEMKYWLDKLYDWVKHHIHI